MIIKKRDSRQFEIDELLSLLSLPLPNDKKFLIERELRFMKSGDRGENDSSYYIDYYYTSSKNWAVIHDFRLEYDKRVAQIDHLLINRFLDIYVLESKNFSYGLKITDDGQFLIINNNDYIAIESPLEQNKRHVALLEKFLEEKDIVPKRLGLTISTSFQSYVLISPKSRLIRPSSTRFNTTSVIKADTLKTTIENAVDNMSPTLISKRFNLRHIFALMFVISEIIGQFRHLSLHIFKPKGCWSRSSKNLILVNIKVKRTCECGTVLFINL